MGLFTTDKNKNKDKTSNKELKKSADLLSSMAMTYYGYLRTGRFDKALETALAIRACADVWINIAKASTNMMESIQQSVNNLQKGIDLGSYK